MMRPMLLTLICAGLIAGPALAETRNLSPKEQYSIDTQRAAERYSEDKKLCADEGSSKLRMQCTRDAKSEYNNALATAKAALRANGVSAAPVAQSQPQSAAPAICNECGKVLAVNVTEKAGDGGAVGMITGGVAGALLGHQVGGGRGKDIATLAGAAGGAYAGNKVEQHMRTTTLWTVSVQYENGQKSSYNFDQDPGLKAGDHVRSAGGSIARR